MRPVKSGQHEGDHENEVGEDSPGDQAADEGCDQEGDCGNGGVVDGGRGPRPSVLGADTEMSK